MKRYPEWLLGTVTVAITVAICVVVAEVVLRFLPVASSLYTVPVTAQNPVFHFTPNRDFVYSRDWDMVLANRGHVNNAGFVNDQDYQKDGSLPMLAVVGDSMIEAAMFPIATPCMVAWPPLWQASCGCTALPRLARRSASI